MKKIATAGQFITFLTLIWLSSFASAGLKEVSPAQLQSMLDQGVVAIDIRTPQEWQQTGIIPGSKTLMFFDAQGQYNIDSWLQEFEQLVTEKNQSFVLICRSANRTGRVGNFLAGQLKMENVYHLDGGIKNWIKQQQPVTSP